MGGAKAWERWGWQPGGLRYTRRRVVRQSLSDVAPACYQFASANVCKGDEVMTVVLHAQQGAQKLGMQQSKLLCALAPVAGRKKHTSQP